MRGVLILTGPPRSGKTTLVEKLVSTYGGRWKGFLTREVRKDNERMGFMVIRDEGTPTMLAEAAASGGPRVGKYRVNLEAIEKIIIDFLESPGVAPFYYVDEVGKMEMAHPHFAYSFRRFVSACNGFLIVTVGIRYLRWVQNICPDADTVDLRKLDYDEGFRRAQSWILDKIKV